METMHEERFKNISTDSKFNFGLDFYWANTWIAFVLVLIWNSTLVSGL